MNANTLLRRTVAAMLALLAVSGFAVHPFAADKPRLNVLHIVSDDLCARLGCYGDPMVKSPHIDRLAARGVKFDRAYCQFPLCNPSRASFMTGLRPDTTKVYENRTMFREAVPDAVSIPQSFKKAGYSVARVGKLYHYGVPSQIGTDGLDDPASWEKVVNPKGRDVDDFTMIDRISIAPGETRTTTVKATALTELGGRLSWLAADGTDEEQTDGKGAASAIGMLETCAKSGKPFYLAVGFYRPHTPYVAPKKWFAMYPTDGIRLPAIPANLAEMFPAPALAVQKKEELGMNDDLRRRAIQAYTAATSFMDAQTGKLMAALDRLKLTDRTVIVFHSDHGYHLGEKNLWQKMSIFEESARVPLIISVPGNKANGSACLKPVELVSLHKTLADVCGIAADKKTEGHSLRPLIVNPKAEWKHAAYSQVSRGANVATVLTPEQKKKKAKAKPIMGRSVRTERWRYTEWDEGRAGVELYDHDNDPGEYKNLAADPQHADAAREMKRLLYRKDINQ
ncbi:MAG: sulfatase [Verrucomicrobia bacterium]|nr:sulfatase [Verrucomicrobiota bacterium]